MSNIFDRRPFTAEHQKAISMIYSLSTLAANAPNIMIRANTANLSVDPSSLESVHLDDDVDTFVITTSADPENTIIYTSGKDLLNLNIRDGGYF
jgi:hypothetical protein